MVLKAVIRMLKEIQGIEGNKVQDGSWEVKHLWSGMEAAGEKTEKGLDTREMSAFLWWKHVCPWVSLKACPHLRSWEPETQRDVGMYSGEEGIC